MSEQFTTRLQLQLREAAQREERRGTLASRLSAVRYRMPGPGALAAAAVAAALVVAVIAVGGIDWGGKQDTTTVGPRVIADVALSDNLGQIAPGFGSVWASDVHGKILRVDPRTRSVQQRIQVGGNDSAPGGTPIVNAGAGAVWAIPQPASAERLAMLLRIDPRTGDVASRHALRQPDGRPLSVGDVQILAGVPWVIGSEGSLEIDPATGAPRRFVKTELPAGEPFPLFVTGDDHSLWEITRDERILRYGLATGTREATLPVRLPATVALTPTAAGPVLQTRDGQLALADDSDGRIVWTRRLGNAINGLPLQLGDNLIVHASDTSGGRDRLVVVDLHTGDVRSSTGLPQFGLGGLAVVGHELWLSTPNGHMMILRR